MGYGALLFDVDGTIIDTTDAIVNSLRKVLVEFTGIEYSDEELYVSMGITGSMTMDIFGVTEKERAIELWDRYFLEQYDKVSFFPGIPEMLDAIKGMGYLTGLVTSKTRYELSFERILDEIIKDFDVIVCADDAKRPKPNPDPILKALETLNIKNNVALYVGDSLYDLLSARSAGVPFGVAMWGSKNPERLLELDPKYVFNDPREIVDLLRKDVKDGTY
ncbi:MAG: HAD family hydrolase [Thermoanaerobacteraceae bacterium]|nr:HAD family hydrolase [Thermoanaerobacteraceae bacterium]